MPAEPLRNARRHEREVARKRELDLERRRAEAETPSDPLAECRLLRGGAGRAWDCLLFLLRCPSTTQFGKSNNTGQRATGPGLRGEEFLRQPDRIKQRARWKKRWRPSPGSRTADSALNIDLDDQKKKMSTGKLPSCWCAKAKTGTPGRPGRCGGPIPATLDLNPPPIRPSMYACRLESSPWDPLVQKNMLMMTKNHSNQSL